MKLKIAKLKFRTLKLLHTHQAFVVTMGLLAVASLVVARLSILNNLSPSQKVLDENATKTKTVNFNQQAIDQIKALRDNNVTVPGTEVSRGRDNPFSE